MGEGGIRMEPQRGGRERFINTPCGGLRIETATWIQKYFKKLVGASRNL
jgi:hypothetical protein